MTKYEMILSVYHTHSISVTAEKYNYTQSAISQAIFQKNIQIFILKYQWEVLRSFMISWIRMRWIVSLCPIICFRIIWNFIRWDGNQCITEIIAVQSAIRHLHPPIYGALQTDVGRGISEGRRIRSGDKSVLGICKRMEIK